MILNRVLVHFFLGLIPLCLMLTGFMTPYAKAGPLLLIDVTNNRVLDGYAIDESWHPASLTKLMTTYVALRMTRRGLINLSTPIYMTEEASKAPPSRLGLEPGKSISLKQAIQTLIVASANDIAEAMAVNLSPSRGAFITQMNIAARRLGMKRTHYKNPSGLHHEEQVTTARDTAILAIALLNEFPELSTDFKLTTIKFNNNLYTTHNTLLTSYPEATGMKTGFICPSGYNIVASARQDNRTILAVVLGSPSPKARKETAIALFEAGFHNEALGRYPATSLNKIPNHGLRLSPTNLRAQICDKTVKKQDQVRLIDDETEALIKSLKANKPQKFDLSVKSVAPAEITAQSIQ